MAGPWIPSILLVEDNPSDILMIGEAFVSAGFEVRMKSVWNGQEALEFLQRRGRHASATRPDIVLLDMNLPILSGREVLAAMAADGSLNTIPVVILTGSRFEGSAQQLYPADRSLFIVKPPGFRELVDVIRRVARFAASFREPPPYPLDFAHCTRDEP
ncbi:MAG TPA: response regulator [Candidatus Methanoperedens sp.]|nr:response regulator [Candidatus Methanoperedens sp.]